MAKQRGDRTIEFVPPGGWLKQFASFFHQDYGLLSKDFRAGAAMFVDGLTPDQRKALLTELSAFLAAHENVPPNTLKRQWIKQGAQWCQRGISMREALNELVSKLLMKT